MENCTLWTCPAPSMDGTSASPRGRCTTAPKFGKSRPFHHLVKRGNIARREQTKWARGDNGCTKPKRTLPDTWRTLWRGGRRAISRALIYFACPSTTFKRVKPLFLVVLTTFCSGTRPCWNRKALSMLVGVSSKELMTDLSPVLRLE